MLSKKKMVLMIFGMLSGIEKNLMIENRASRVQDF
jgi:hypothetical protein